MESRAQNLVAANDAAQSLVQTILVQRALNQNGTLRAERRTLLL
jgi:hypothetical protein